jgi:hypothetical protein
LKIVVFTNLRKINEKDKALSLSFVWIQKKQKR